jgi:hypothetical protein
MPVGLRVVWCLRQTAEASARNGGKCHPVAVNRKLPPFFQDGFYTALIAHQQAILEVQHAVGAGSQLKVVRHHDQAGAL